MRTARLACCAIIEFTLPKTAMKALVEKKRSGLFGDRSNFQSSGKTLNSNMNVLELNIFILKNDNTCKFESDLDRQARPIPLMLNRGESLVMPRRSLNHCQCASKLIDTKT